MPSRFEPLKYVLSDLKVRLYPPLTQIPISGFSEFVDELKPPLSRGFWPFELVLFPPLPLPQARIETIQKMDNTVANVSMILMIVILNYVTPV
jgi:hypothetical protein